MILDHSAVAVEPHACLCISIGDTLDTLEQLQAKRLYIIKNLHDADSMIINKLVVLGCYASIVTKNPG